MIKNERKRLRNFILQRRLMLTAKEQQLASTAISKHLSRTLLFLRSKRIAFYFANKKEVDTSVLLKRALSLGKECYFPVLHPIKHNRMWFARYKMGDLLVKNNCGILEPDFKVAQKALPWSLDLVITPLLAFDSKGNRLGMGGGFYDRTFAFLHDQIRTKPTLVGLAYDFQHLSEFPIEKWDVPLDIIITESLFLDLTKSMCI
jgi:5-formyltetrahydrofolate cyclo-ligase